MIRITLALCATMVLCAFLRPDYTADYMILGGVFIVAMILAPIMDRPSVPTNGS